MGPIGKDKLVFDTSVSLVENDNVGAFITASDGTLITHHHIAAGYDALDVYAAMADGAGNAITSTGGALDVNIKSPISVNVDLNGIYDAGGNPTPDNVGLIGSTRAAPGLANQTLQFTGGSVASDAVSASNIVAQDVSAFGMMWNGTTWDRMAGAAATGLKVDVSNSSIAVTQSTSPWVVSNSGTFAVQAAQSGTWTVGLSEDHNYGAVGAATLRTAAQIGNATGAADFGAGATSAQTLRVVLPTDQSAIPVTQGTTPWIVNSSVPNTAFHTASVSVDNTAGGVALFASPLADRKSVLIQNLGNKEIYIGESGVTVGTGIRIAAGGNWEVAAGPAQALYAIAGSAAAQNVRVFQIA